MEFLYSEINEKVMKVSYKLQAKSFWMGEYNNFRLTQLQVSIVPFRVVCFGVYTPGPLPPPNAESISGTPVL